MIRTVNSAKCEARSEKGEAKNSVRAHGRAPLLCAPRSSLFTGVRPDAGFTILELMIAMVVMAIAVVAIYSAVQRSGLIYSHNATVTMLEATAGAMSERLMEELAFADPTAMAADGTSVTFWLPIDADGENGPLDEDGDIEWGYGDHLNYTRRISFEAVGSVNEGVRDEDVNLDGDRVDAFSVGRLVIETFDDAGASLGDAKPIGPPLVMVTSPVAGLDVDGDGANDPIFARYAADGVTASAAGPILGVRLILGAEDEDGLFHMCSHRIFIKLRNQQ